ncbi:hypothetical protein [Frondihabitans australicus]|uniref:Uncharacterized protein n=1 Tax=Frondihabitans australicus TaxID=386892 RepID=A0A495IHI3_9MICO|nr:hypothetical protein [Frondihabitans australicus]RKR74615.1 hypothetical protein C8E83_1736 [Frondihabitans australicus]
MTRTESVFDRLALRTGRALVDWSQRPERSVRSIDADRVSRAHGGSVDSLSATRFH